MEFIELTLFDAIQTLVDNGQRKIRVLPLFMAAGARVKNDIVPLVDDLNRRHAGVSVELLDPVGEHPTLLTALRQIAAAALSH